MKHVPFLLAPASSQSIVLSRHAVPILACVVPPQSPSLYCSVSPLARWRAFLVCASRYVFLFHFLSSFFFLFFLFFLLLCSVCVSELSHPRTLSDISLCVFCVPLSESLARNPDLDAACQQLVDLAVAHDSSDNISGR